MNLSGNITNGIGQAVRRKEDFRLLTRPRKLLRRCPPTGDGPCGDRAQSGDHSELAGLLIQEEVVMNVSRRTVPSPGFDLHRVGLQSGRTM